MAENDIEIFAEVGTGSLLPGGRAGIRLRRTWQSRQEAFARSILDKTGHDAESLDEALADDEQLADIFVKALGRASSTSEPFYRAALANLVAAALDKTTTIDVADALIDHLLRLDIAAMRLLYGIYEPRDAPDLAHGRHIHFSVASALRAQPNETLVEPALAQLRAAGFIEQAVDVMTSIERSDAQSDVDISYDRTSWGEQAFTLCRMHETPPD
ncbi:MAG: hypothetical protein EON52_00015 [Actinomycetales bacterium]|nr:MAG: hypothetical protein EON52_00015 [Actinomycetales bacterium]